MDIRCGHCGGHHESVASVRECGQVANARPWTLSTPVAKPVDKPGVATEGMYRKGGQIYRVATGRQSGQLYVQRLDRVEVELATGQTEFSYVAAPGMARTLSQADRMDKDEAMAFGQLTGTCIRCGLKLTHPDSVKRGIGPVCLTKI